MDVTYEMCKSLRDVSYKLLNSTFVVMVAIVAFLSMWCMCECKLQI
jgi:hypothetical protein